MQWLLFHRRCLRVVTAMRLLPAIAVVAALAAAVLSACGDSTTLEVSPPTVVEP
ncbi:MAG: hypothetical protein ING40_14345, partial [Burkholderiales bacterium]|nr:hypothetical protein [Burkholderiales bacterium]